MSTRKGKSVVDQELNEDGLRKQHDRYQRLQDKLYESAMFIMTPSVIVFTIFLFLMCLVYAYHVYTDQKWDEFKLIISSIGSFILGKLFSDSTKKQ